MDRATRGEKCKFRSRLRMLHSRRCRICHPLWQALGTLLTSRKKKTTTTNRCHYLKGNFYHPHSAMIFQYINSELKITCPACQDRVVMFLRESRRCINLFIVFVLLLFFFHWWESEIPRWLKLTQVLTSKKLPKKIKLDLNLISALLHWWVVINIFTIA